MIVDAEIKLASERGLNDRALRPAAFLSGGALARAWRLAHEFDEIALLAA